MIPPVTPENVVSLCAEAMFLGMEINKRLFEMHKKGNLYAGHPYLEMGRQIWDRYQRRRAMAELLVEGVQSNDEEVLRAAMLHAEATALVERLNEISERPQIDFNFLGQLIRKAIKRRARRLHNFAIITKRSL